MVVAEPTSRPAPSIPPPSPFSDLCVLRVSAFSSLPSPSVCNLQVLQLSILSTSLFANSFRFRTYKKAGEGVPLPTAQVSFPVSAPQRPAFISRFVSLPPFFITSSLRYSLCARRNSRNFNLFMALLHNSRTPRGWGGTTHHSLFTTHSLPLETPTRNGASLSMYMQERPGGPGTQVLTMRRFLMAIATLAVLPAMASAQRGGMSGTGHAAVSAPHASMAMHAAPASGSHLTSQTNYGVRPPSGMHWVRTRSGAIVARPIQRS